MPKDKQDALYIKKLYNKISDFCWIKFNEIKKNLQKNKKII
jgi:hypothetical protein